MITDSAGNIKADSDYYPWGGELQFVNSDTNHYKFTSKERDETGLDYFGARYYSNGLGRFITPDWAAKAAAVPYAEFADPQSLNLYSYVRNIPTARFDPDGHLLQEEDVKPPEVDAKQEAKEAADVREAESKSNERAEREVADQNAKDNDKKVQGGYDDVTGVCHVNPPASQSGASVSAPGTAPSAPDYMVSPGGDVIVIPQGSSGPTAADNGKGIQFKGGSGGPGLDSKVTGVRVMDPKPARGGNAGFPNGYVSYMNAQGQTVNPNSGRVISLDDPMAHIPLSPPPPTQLPHP